MKEMVQMVVVLSVICAACALLLSGVRGMTAERIEEQVLINVQGPAVKAVLAGSDNDLIADRRTITVDDTEMLMFVGMQNGQPWAVAYQSTGSGFGGDLEVMAGYDLASDRLTGMRVVLHKETPGIGSKVTEEQFTKQFVDLGLSANFELKGNGGDIEAITGATYSSRGACRAVKQSAALYPAVKQKMLAP